MKTLDPIREAVLNTTPRMIHVVANTGAIAIVVVAWTGVAEWLHISYRAK